KYSPSAEEGVDARIPFPRPVNPEDEIQPCRAGDVRYLMKNIAFVRVLRRNFRKRTGETQRAVQIADRQRRFSRGIAKLRLVMPLRQHHARALRRRKGILRQIGGEAVPGILLK